jgi:cytochrome c
MVVGLAAASAVAADLPPTDPATQAGRFGLGRPATAEEIAAWDIDVNPAGVGLPAGRATAADGGKVWAAKCASCHGARGEGNERYPRLVGRHPEEGFPFGRQLKYVRTVGNYWPYATTLYDYIHRAMPPTAPGSLAPAEIYGVVAWLLTENRIIAPGAVIDAVSLPRVQMPARDRFVDDDRTGGSEFR